MHRVTAFPARLSKSRFLAGLQCRKRLYLEIHHRDLATDPGPATQRIFASGHKVGELARNQFPGGVLIDPPPYEIERALRETETAIADGASVVYEPAFIHDNVFIRADVLARTDTGAWDLIEVKSTTRTSDTHVADAAIQRHVARGAGLSIRNTYVMHLNRGCRYPDLSNLFELDEVSDRIDAMWPELAPRVAEFNELLIQPAAPHVPIGKHCTTPYDCSFMEHCWRNVKHPSIFTIPRISAEKIDALVRQGVTGIERVPETFRLSENQRRYVDFFKSGQKQILSPAIADALAILEYPLYFLDFETMADPVPRLDGLGPYHQYPFQFSLHVMQPDGTIEHREYLHPDTTDPRGPLTEALIRTIVGTGTIVAYNAPFEQRVIRDLSRRFPKHRRQLMGCLDRFFDLLVIFRDHYFDPDFGGSNSIKHVLPVLVPELSYATLEVQSGDLAQLAWQEMISSADASRRLALAGSLKRYCELDTWAMVRLYQELRIRAQGPYGERDTASDL
jgi:hypothetical protein